MLDPPPAPEPEPAASQGSWFSGLPWQAVTLIAGLAMVVMLLGGVLLGTWMGDDDPDIGAASGTTATSSPVTSGPEEAIPDIPTSPPPTTAATSTTAPATTTTSSTPTTIAAPPATLTTTAPPATLTTAAPPATLTTAAPPTTVSTILFQTSVSLEVGHGVDLDTGDVYTFPTNPDLIDQTLAAAVDVVLQEVLAGGTGHNVVMGPRNGAQVVITPTDECSATTGLFASTKVFTNVTGGAFDGYYCYLTNQGNYSLVAAVAVAGPQGPVGFGVGTFAPPGLGSN